MLGAGCRWVTCGCERERERERDIQIYIYIYTLYIYIYIYCTILFYILSYSYRYTLTVYTFLNHEPLQFRFGVIPSDICRMRGYRSRFGLRYSGLFRSFGRPAFLWALGFEASRDDYLGSGVEPCL